MLCLFAGVVVFGQGKAFSDPNAEYTFDIPDERWKMTVKPSATNRSVEMVYVDRNDGHFEVRKLSFPTGKQMEDVVREEETKLQFNPGYVPGKEENFRGKLGGTVFNFEYVKAGRPMSGRFYFLQADNSVYVLRFTGFRDKLRSIRNQTDMIGRTFEILKN
jgi:hypothetical protein